MPPTSERFNPVDQDMLVMDNSARNTTAQVDLSLIEHAPKPYSKSLFVAGEGALLGCNPGNFPLSDDTTRHRFQTDFAESHERDVTNMLHSAWVSGLPWLSERKFWARFQHPKLGTRACVVVSTARYFTAAIAWKELNFCFS